jgi:hypothetical protein
MKKINYYKTLFASQELTFRDIAFENDASLLGRTDVSFDYDGKLFHAIIVRDGENFKITKVNLSRSRNTDAEERKKVRVINSIVGKESPYGFDVDDFSKTEDIDKKKSQLKSLYVNFIKQSIEQAESQQTMPSDSGIESEQVRALEKELLDPKTQPNRLDEIYRILDNADIMPSMSKELQESLANELRNKDITPLRKIQIYRYFDAAKKTPFGIKKHEKVETEMGEAIHRQFSKRYESDNERSFAVAMELLEGATSWQLDDYKKSVEQKLQHCPALKSFLLHNPETKEFMERLGYETD